LIVGRVDFEDGPRAALWTEATGFQNLGSLSVAESAAHAISDDGRTVVGESGLPPTGTTLRDQLAFRWTATEGLVALGDFPGGEVNSGARGVSSDGSVIVGYGQPGDGLEAARWTAAEGMIGLADLPGGPDFSVANGVSADGRVIVG
jgi:uncharacterized membrane protein